MSYLGINNTYYTEYFADSIIPKGKHEAAETGNLREIINTYFLYRRFTLRDLVDLMLRNGYLKDYVSETHVIKSLSNSLASMKCLARKRIKKRHQDPIPALIQGPTIKSHSGAGFNLSVVVATATALAFLLMFTWVVYL